MSKKSRKQSSKAKSYSLLTGLGVAWAAQAGSFVDKDADSARQEVNEDALKIPVESHLSESSESLLAYEAHGSEDEAVLSLLSLSEHILVETVGSVDPPNDAGVPPGQHKEITPGLLGKSEFFSAGNELSDFPVFEFTNSFGTDSIEVLAQADASSASSSDSSKASNASKTAISPADASNFSLAGFGSFLGASLVVAAAGALISDAARPANSQELTPADKGDGGKISDGYISGAKVFRDVNGDGIWNDVNGNGLFDLGDEPMVLSDEFGNFAGLSGVGDVIAMGGTDISTGLAFKGVLKAPDGSVSINPLTTEARRAREKRIEKMFCDRDLPLI
jgi:hypothetical protein